MNEIQRMQKYLLLIRRTVGWTAEEFGSRIGVTRQTINNIEAGRNKLNQTQYIAMRSVLDREILMYPEETKMLKLILDMFVDHPENYTDKDKEELLAKANMITPSILAGATTRADVSKELVSTAISILGAAVFAVAMDVATDWLTDILSNRKK